MTQRAKLRYLHDHGVFAWPAGTVSIYAVEAGVLIRDDGTREPYERRVKLITYADIRRFLGY